MTDIKTVSFDPSVYKLVPIRAAIKMKNAAKAFQGCSDKIKYEAMLERIPEIPVGVIFHAAPPEPANAIDAERRLSDDQILQFAECFRCRMTKEDKDIGAPPIFTTARFDLNLIQFVRAILAAMKDAK
jgi:hypothetical protein